MSDFPIDFADIEVKGVPVRVVTTWNGYYAMASSQTVYVNDSPLLIYFDPPVAPAVGTQMILEKLP